MLTRTGRCETCGADLGPVPLVVGIDLDLTTLGTDDQVAPRTIRGISAASACGIRVVLATGQPMHDALIWREVLGAHWAIAMNGVAASGPSGRVTILARPLPESFLATIQTAASKDDGLSLNFHTLNGWYPARIDEAAEEYARRHHRTPTKGLWARNTVLMVELTGSAATLDALSNSLPEMDRFSVTRSRDSATQYLDIGPAGTAKDVGFTHVLKARRATWDQAVVIGDGPNDLPLFERARIGVAVAGAVPELEAVATHRIERGADEGAVGVVLEALLQRKQSACRELICLHRKRS